MKFTCIWTYLSEGEETLGGTKHFLFKVIITFAKRHHKTERIKDEKKDESERRKMKEERKKRKKKRMKKMKDERMKWKKEDQEEEDGWKK